VAYANHNLLPRRGKLFVEAQMFVEFDNIICVFQLLWERPVHPSKHFIKTPLSPAQGL